MKILGFDPGGGAHFGCAMADTSAGSVQSYTATSVDDAIDWAVEKLRDDIPRIAGIDTLLFWQSTRSGWRGADLYLRSRYPGCRNSVLCANGLYGSMAVQGAVLAYRLREAWPQIELTETHPKVLWHHFHPAHPYPRNWSEREHAQNWLHSLGWSIADISTEDEFDAIVSVWAAFQALSGNWTNDLSLITAPNQMAANVLLVSGAHFFWPD